MFPELGHFSLLLSLLLAVALAIVPLLGVYKNSTLLMASARSLSTGMFIFLLLSFLFLMQSFLLDDFSVKYVANHSNTLLPGIYKISAVWGGHEGSLLLWGLILALWTFAVAVFSKHMPLDMVARVLAVMGMVAVGFLVFMIFTSNPFDRILPFPPEEGSDLNPLLQDPGLIIHPPMLYMGYVGFSVAFAFAIAALLSGRLDSTWARWARPWTTVAWAFLTLGIALGSWWAYYELGWGGWWFWDPVENASFMPWLVGTALIHSLAVTEKLGVFKSWTLLLAIFSFSLSLLGTFLVRSGVLTSVHAFANDPERGAFILGFLLVVTGGALLLYALRAPVVKGTSFFHWLSREIFLLANNIVLVIIMLTVLLGTLYPLFADALNLGKISVGPPYFNTFFVPLMGLLAILMGIGPLVFWKKTTTKKLWGLLKKPIVAAIVLGALFPLFYNDNYSLMAAVAVSIGLWIILALCVDVMDKTRNAPSRWQGLGKLTKSYYGMVFAHSGVAVMIWGASLNTIYSDQRDLRMEENDRVALGRYEYHLVEIKGVRGPNYIAQQAHIDVYDDGVLLNSLFPQKRRYFSTADIMTEAGITSGLFGDLYVALGESLGTTTDGRQAWAVRLHNEPFVGWIWLGALLMAFGGFLAIADKRYRVKKFNNTKAELCGGSYSQDTP